MADGVRELGWDDVERLAACVAERIEAAAGVRSFDRVIGVARGGLVPAVLVAARLGVKRVETVQVRLYEGARRLAAPVVVGAAPPDAGPGGDPARTLILDEMLDSGTTLRFLHARYPQATLAALVARGPDGCDEDAVAGLLASGWAAAGGEAGRPVWVARRLGTDRWILFPWSPAEDRAAGAGSP
jgi:xanthine phosphoribosyltransferase